MSEPKEKVDISDLTNAFLECPVCMEHFNQTDRRPRLLHSCLHAFCRFCLHQLLDKEGKGQITCPLCRQVQKVARTVDSLPVDPVRDQLLDYLAITHKTNVPCNDCPDGKNANSRCVECGDNLCQDCKNAHSRNKSTRGHKVIPFGELDQEACGTLKINKHFCKNHSDRLIECFCENCEVLCCLLCGVIEHKGHDLKKLEDAAGIRIKETEKRMADVENVHDKLATAKKDCETYAEDIQKEKKRLLLEIDARFDSAEQLLRERRMSLRKGVEESSDRLASAAKKNGSLYGDTLTEIQSLQTYFSNAKSKTDGVSVLQIYPSLKANLSNLAKTHSGTIPICSEKITFRAAEEDNVHRYIRRYGVVSSIQTVEGGPNGQTCASGLSNPNLSEEFQDCWHIPRKSLVFDKKLGIGQYTEVWKGSRSADVVIKVLKSGTISSEDFIAEAVIMKQCKHENLVRLFGVCIQEEPMYIVTEFMSKGDLLTYLRDGAGKTMDSQYLIHMATQIASGMTFLEKIKIIHRHLAARNIMVGNGNVVKVAEFEMAKFLEYDEYNLKEGESRKILTKWSPPEVYLYGRFSIKSDVWSYGILLMELMTRGQIPYPGLSNRDTLEKVKKGFRMQRPLNCPERVYNIMLKCWEMEPENRPTFDYLNSFFDDLQFQEY